MRIRKSPYTEPKTIKNIPKINISDEMRAYLDKISIEFFFSEFGENRVNGGGSVFNEVSRLEPTLSTLKHYFPNAKYTVYTNFDLEIDGVQSIKVYSPIPNKNHPRYFHHSTNYFKFKALLDSDADFKCSIDSDMFVVSEGIYNLVYLTEIFGFCAPYNPRNLLKKDMRMSKDAKEIVDLSGGNGHSYNQSPMTLWKNHSNGRLFYEKCCEIMIKEPSRASLVMWKAAKESGYSPYLLPKEFCVCNSDVGCEDEIMLHIGHSKVAEH